jgi:hypothetical protein
MTNYKTFKKREKSRKIKCAPEHLDEKSFAGDPQRLTKKEKSAILLEIKRIKG